MEHFIEPGTEVNGNSETHPSAKSVRISGAYQSSSTKDVESSEQKNIKQNGHCHTGLPHRNESFNARDNDKKGKSDTKEKQMRNETLQSEEMNTRLHEETEVNSYPNTELANGMAYSTSHQLQDFVLDNKKENQNESQETELKLQHSEKRMVSEVGFQCDVEKSERREPAMIIRGDKKEVKTQRGDKTLQDATTSMKAIQDNTTTIKCKLENASHENEVLIFTLKKHIQEQEMEIQKMKNTNERCEKEKSEIQQKYDEAFLKLVGDNRRMNENLKEIQTHVRREKIESERTKNEVEQVLQERQKLVDQVKELSKGFESMIGERDRMEIVIETSISAFDSKLCEKDEEIRDLLETIDNDRKQFMEERDQYLTVIESLKAQLLLQEEHTRYSKAI
ncbi:golgin subfamily A member 6-like protein 4 [Mizuhopecten yessoensis]|uniref:Uncharacterized protein n=1 Tax=Mizuhopecten yessoensis TaxID=6573 RepID=A0A210Q9M0_MIZYE|nr:golgin subfamily A member 6-like protein 4 [Mizuhopecten yessoensis]OWF45389.1 hypothetical protein KP79_PYT19331 [Mizuhopecten yessoensis]